MHRYSLILVLPLLLLYEALASVLSHDPRGDVRNGADVILKGLFVAIAGSRGPAIFMALVIALSLWLIRRDLRENGRGFQLGVFAGMAAESVAYALAFGLVVGLITARLLGVLATLAMGPVQTLAPSRQLMISLGAGLYEELLFRVVLVSALAFGARSLLGWSRRLSGVVAVLLGAAIFSAFHYVGAFGDPLTLESFTYRMIGGIFFSALYLLRGFGITAWTHSLYDVLLLMR